MLVQELGEEGIIHQLQGKFFPPKGVMGIGDDAAVIGEWLVTTDALVEGIHFLKETISARDLGYKLMAVNISDIAAMGGEPKYAFLSMALPKETDSQWLQEVMEGIHEGCIEWGVSLLGGDTVGSKRDLFFNVTLMGRGENGKIKYRSGAKLGDVICATGFLGDSGGGLKALQEGLKIEELIYAHVHPRAHVKEGLILGAEREVHAMMDCSDGLDRDLRRLIAASKCGAIIDVDRLPISECLRREGAKRRWDVWTLALTGGEDYVLLTTVSRGKFAEIRERLGGALYEIGEITDEVGVLRYEKGGKPITFRATSFDHFA